MNRVPLWPALKFWHKGANQQGTRMQDDLKAINGQGMPARAWQRMLSGRRLDLLDPSPLDIEIGDIAHGLARVARWNGQTKGEHAFSVAQHCVLVEAIAGALKPRLDRKFRLAALLHDAPEYVVGDLISPFKAAMGLNYKSFEDRILRAIHIRFGLPPALPQGVLQLIKKSDKIAAYHEATQLAGFSVADARQYFGDPAALDVKLPGMLQRLDPLATAEAQNAYIERFCDLEATQAKAKVHAG
jgi:5'-deoxynucleotidase YfbR-like HD superfamily hydrolase